jgi:hypothetical protein
VTLSTPTRTFPTPGQDDRSTGSTVPTVCLGPLKVAAWSAPAISDTEPMPGDGPGPHGWPEVPVCGDVAVVVNAEDRLRLLVADVAGHGLEAAPLAGALHAAFALLAKNSGVGLPALVSALDSLVALLGTVETYATACVLDLYPDATLVVANCGHPWPLVSVETGQWRKLAPARASLPLGVGARPTFDVYRLSLGSTFVVHTDGMAIERSEQSQRPDVDAMVAGVLAAGSPPVRSPVDDATVVVGQWATSVEGHVPIPGHVTLSPYGMAPRTTDGGFAEGRRRPRAPHQAKKPVTEQRRAHRAADQART